MPATNTAPVNVAPLFAQGLQLHEQGRLADAERLYMQVLAARPEHFDALQMLGLIRLAKDEPADALRLVGKAMQMRAPSPQILLNYGLILHALKRSEEALASFEQAIRQKSKFAEAHNNKGAVLTALGRHDEALPCYRTALQLKPNYAEAHYNLGSSLRALGRFDEAIASFDRALAQRPNYAKALNNRGAAYEALGRTQDALTDYDKALALNPRFLEARNNRSRVLLNLGRSTEAIDNFALALAHDPNNVEALCLRGKFLIDSNRLDEAAADFRRALAIQPNRASASLGACLAELSVVYRSEDELAAHRIRYEGQLRRLHADTIAGRLQDDAMKAVELLQPFFLAYQGGVDRELQAIYGDIVGRIVAKRFAAARLPLPPAPGEPIRLGVVSAFFNLHSNWKIPIKGWLSQLDRSRFKITCYHLGHQRDGETDVAAAMCDRFVHRDLDIEGWRREILSDAPHALIYPGLLMDAKSLPLAAQRLAPVQCTSWGHPETSGLPTLDYFLSSDLMEPADADTHYTETLVRLPNLSIYYEPLAVPPVPVIREELGLRPNAIVFWSAQSLYKYLPRYDEIFPRIAARARDCQFVFIRHFGGPQITQVFRERLDAAFATAGLRSDDHCVFVDKLSQAKFVAAAGLADVFLDSIGWSGCNSMLEALAHDLPVVTMAGATMRGRHGLAIMQMLEADESVAASVDDYVERAVRLASDATARKAMREKIARNKHRLYRDRAPVTALEDFLEKAVRRATV